MTSVPPPAPKGLRCHCWQKRGGGGFCERLPNRCSCVPTWAQEQVMGARQPRGKEGERWERRFTGNRGEGRAGMGGIGVIRLLLESSLVQIHFDRQQAKLPCRLIKIYWSEDGVTAMTEHESHRAGDPSMLESRVTSPYLR
uniref:Uncharacterized protein n=1 Tax=Sphaerodactylus townsendi TaxID=933632 RepID=A0ACB8F322_9SAUR